MSQKPFVYYAKVVSGLKKCKMLVKLSFQFYEKINEICHNKESI